MDSSQTKEKITSEKLSGDPFASDIFAAPKSDADSDLVSAVPSKIENKNSWIWRLPKVSRPIIDWDQLWRNLPPDFSDKLPSLLAESLSEYLNPLDKKSLEILFLNKKEVGEANDETNDSWWINIKIENSAADFFVEINNSLASWLVDATLGEQVPGNAPTRNLTPSEIAVLEFLAMNLIHDTNRIINAPLFKLHSLSQNLAALSNEKTINSNSAKSSSKIISSWQIVHNNQQSIIKLHFTPEALNALQTDKNSLLTAAPRRAVIWDALQNRVKTVRSRIFIGDAQVTLADVAGLEKGDVVLMENYDFSINEGDFYGHSKIFLGDGEHVKINAMFETSAEGSSIEVEENSTAADNEFLVKRIKSNHFLRFFVESFEELEMSQLTDKAMLEEQENLNGGESEKGFDEWAEGGVALENLAVTLRVELEARRLSLAEIGNLRVNQIIELGARATDSVNLIINDRIVARGELVEVEEQLGVRIVQILR